MDNDRDEIHAHITFRCEECGRAWDQANERWRVYLTSDEPPQAVAYCPDCAQREFGD